MRGKINISTNNIQFYSRIEILQTVAMVMALLVLSSENYKLLMHSRGGCGLSTVAAVWASQLCKEFSTMKGTLASLRRERRGRGNREEKVKVRGGGGEWEGGPQKKIKTTVKLKLINNVMVTIVTKDENSYL